MPSFTDFPKLLTTNELAEATAGGDAYIRTKGNVVKGLALRLDINPRAPEVVAFGSGPRIRARAQLLYESGATVPAYVKRDTNAWEYLGEYRATAIRRDKRTIARYGKNRKKGSVDGVLFLEGVAEPIVRVIGGGFADAETRREIELAAISYATGQLERRGFCVFDRQRENRGYDLYATSATDSLKVEVKGTDSAEPRFFLSRNEWKCSASEPDWLLMVVCQARSNPSLLEYTAKQLRQRFKMDPLAWECTIK